MTRVEVTEPIVAVSLYAEQATLIHVADVSADRRGDRFFHVALVERDVRENFFQARFRLVKNLLAGLRVLEVGMNNRVDNHQVADESFGVKIFVCHVRSPIKVSMNKYAQIVSERN